MDYERSECRQAIFRGLIKCRAHNNPPYRNLYFISGVIKIIFHTIKISLCTMYHVIAKLFHRFLKHVSVKTNSGQMHLNAAGHEGAAVFAYVSRSAQIHPDAVIFN